MKTFTLSEPLLNQALAALDYWIKHLEDEVRIANAELAIFWGGSAAYEDAQRAIVWNTDALLSSKLAREVMGDGPESAERTWPGDAPLRASFVPCTRCGESPARHNSLSDAYVGHDYRVEEPESADPITASKGWAESELREAFGR